MKSLHISSGQDICSNIKILPKTIYKLVSSLCSHKILDKNDKLLLEEI